MRHYQTYCGKVSPTLLAMIMLVIVTTSRPVFCEVSGTSLLIQQSPVQGGKLNVELGVHKLARGSEMVLAATAKPGYSFVYWLGDVSAPMSSRTSVFINGPKIVIAVFEKNEYPGLFDPEQPRSSLNDTNGGGGRQISAGADYSNTIYTGGGYPEYDSPDYIFDDNSEDNDIDDDFPTPEGDKDFPVPGEPVPEPATFILMMLGGAYLSRQRNRR